MTYYRKTGNSKGSVVHTTLRCDYCTGCEADYQTLRPEIVESWDTLETCDVCCESD